MTLAVLPRGWELRRRAAVDDRAAIDGISGQLYREAMTDDNVPQGSAVKHRTFSIEVLGRTLEHLGTQMYKRRDVAIAELVANAWDAGATEVRIKVPRKYSQMSSALVVADNGTGMTVDQVDQEYLVIGRNRRAVGQPAPKSRRIMGRKGVGKLAGFGLGKVMTVLTWRDGIATEFALDGAKLKAEGGQSKTLDIDGTLMAIPDDLDYPTGTRVTMTQLKHKTPPDVDGLHRSLARRFSRTVTGEMAISINDEPLREIVIDFEVREPLEGTITEDVPVAGLTEDAATPASGNSTEPLVNDPADGRSDAVATTSAIVITSDAVDATVDDPAKASSGTVTWWAGFSQKVLPTELQGFTILVNGKTAQAPPFFFNVEGTASGQHGTKYLTGVIEADFLDDGDDDESDRISTDRQEIDWEDEAAIPLRLWGDALTRRLLRDRSAIRERRAEKTVDAVPELRARIDHLDKPSRDQANRFIRALGNAETQQEKIIPLADTIVRAFEYRQFHDYIDELDAAVEDPAQFEAALEHLHGWKVLESRAILEVVQGRINIVDKFFSMIVNDASETAHVRGNDNLHDLVASYPWLINPQWQVLAEEKSITKQLIEWGAEDLSEEDRTRYDFLALTGDGQTVVIEIKRGAHSADFEDLQQLERYVNKLGAVQPNIRGAFISGSYNILASIEKFWLERDDMDLFTWGEIHTRTAEHYRHYKAILDSELGNGDFDRKVREVALTRTVLESGSYRSKEERAAGLGPQDVDHGTTDRNQPPVAGQPAASDQSGDA